MLSAILQSTIDKKEWSSFVLKLQEVPYLQEAIREELNLIAVNLQQLDPESIIFKLDYTQLRRDREHLLDLASLYELDAESPVVIINNF